jgi:outer membrane immunogenic protein
MLLAFWGITMRRFNCVALAAVAVFGFASVTFAADMPVKAPMMAPVYNWTGIYVGAVGSYGWADAQHCSVLVPCVPGNPVTNMKGALGGVTLGANYQINNIVFGVEGDWSGGRLNGSSPTTLSYGCAGTCDNSITSVATLRGRLGFAWNQIMVYATAGGAWERLTASLGTPALVSNSTTKSNFVWGAGVEYGITQNWSTKVEFLRTSKLDTFVYDTNGTCGATCTLETKELNLVRFGLNYRFKGI